MPCADAPLPAANEITYHPTLRRNLTLWPVFSPLILAGCGPGAERTPVTQLIKQDDRITVRHRKRRGARLARRDD